MHGDRSTSCDGCRDAGLGLHFTSFALLCSVVPHSHSPPGGSTSCWCLPSCSSSSSSRSNSRGGISTSRPASRCGGVSYPHTACLLPRAPTPQTQWLRISWPHQRVRRQWYSRLGQVQRSLSFACVNAREFDFLTSAFLATFLLTPTPFLFRFCFLNDIGKMCKNHVSLYPCTISRLFCSSLFILACRPFIFLFLLVSSFSIAIPTSAYMLQSLHSLYLLSLLFLTFTILHISAQYYQHCFQCTHT